MRGGCDAGSGAVLGIPTLRRVSARVLKRRSLRAAAGTSSQRPESGDELAASPPGGGAGALYFLRPRLLRTKQMEYFK